MTSMPPDPFEGGLSDFDLPFERSPQPTWMDLDDGTILCGGLVVSAGFAPAPGLSPSGRLPILVFRFIAADGQFVDKTLTLALDDDGMRKIGERIGDAISTAREGAS